MISTAKIVVLFFFIFLSAPTIVGLIEKNLDITIFYTTVDSDEITKDVESEFKFDLQSVLFFNQLKERTKLIISENLLKHNNVSKSIFIPPPDFV